MKLNTHFAKLNNRIPEYAPIPLLLVIHHHEEYDVPVLDPETGEPTGETEHVVNDWDTTETKIRPSPNDYIQMGWLPVLDKAPSPEPGYTFQKTGYADEISGKIVMEYEKVPVPPVVHTYKRSYLAQWMRANGKWETFNGLLGMSEDLEFFWETSTEFDSNHPQWGTVLTAVKSALELSDEDIAEMLEYGERGNIQ